MKISSAVRKFIESIPRDELYEDRLRDLAKSAGRLAFDEPQLAAPFLIIQSHFNALANNWEGEALDAGVPQEITPPVREAVREALERPGSETILALERVMRWASKLPLKEVPPN